MHVCIHIHTCMYVYISIYTYVAIIANDVSSEDILSEYPRAVARCIAMRMHDMTR